VPLTEFQPRASAIGGLTIITSKQVSDERGTVREFFRESTYAALAGSGLATCSQINVTYTRQGAIRGLHGEDMSKLVGIAVGEALGAYVDARPGSSSFGVVETVHLVPGVQVLVPRGVLNGFQSVSEGGCEYVYGFDAEWHPDMPGVGAYALDPELAISWPLAVDPDDRSMLSAKDAALPAFAKL
jgi:dTDP-4-dehydrorhamnose 3,5-epimerase